jgi:hypothetical protein
VAAGRLKRPVSSTSSAEEVGKVLNLGYIPDANGPTVGARDLRVRTAVGEVIIDCEAQLTGSFKAPARSDTA